MVWIRRSPFVGFRLASSLWKAGDYIRVVLISASLILAWLAMVKCSSCGKENEDNATFCTNCGARLQGSADSQRAEASSSERSPEWSGSKPSLRHHEGEGFLGAVSAGVILIILAMTYLRYPNVFSAFVGYIRAWEFAHGFVKPPPVLVEPGIFFLEAVAVWSLVLAVLRIIVQRSARKAVGELAGALFCLFVAFLLIEYISDVYAGRTVLAYLVIGVGFVVVVNALATFAFPGRQDERNR